MMNSFFLFFYRSMLELDLEHILLYVTKLNEC